MNTKTLNPVPSQIKNIEQFYQELLTNSNLQEKLKAANNPEHLCQLAVELGNEMGYNFTLEQAQAALAIEIAIGDLQEENLISNPPLAFGCCAFSQTCQK
jgi:hypothetical protein